MWTDRSLISNEQVLQLRTSPYVAYISPTTIRFTDDCKKTMYSRMLDGERLPDILQSLGIDPAVLGPTRINGLAQGLKRLGSQMGWDQDRPQKPKSTVSPSPSLTAKQLKMLEKRIAYLEAEVALLKKLIVNKEAARGNHIDPDDLVPPDLP